MLVTSTPIPQIKTQHGTGSGPTLRERSPLRTKGQDINLLTHDQPATTEEQASLTATQGMDGVSSGHAISAEQRLKQRVQPSCETIRMGRQAMERETRAVKHSSKREESPAEVEQPRNKTRVTRCKRYTRRRRRRHTAYPYHDPGQST